ncbi:hypothetical protein LX32DRAFT_634702 [Colletotrichum zoysiae]|uniref:Uncharacterized protein n=1 Tax=Colletotrichum zoysiae TaxID=1216348 RepID=A0AAD9HTK2_9PEZI|nr:hypothetical protein LX32DRAFT_634702 [Colletotrichum zoysiae]
MEERHGMVRDEAVPEMTGHGTLGVSAKGATGCLPACLPSSFPDGLAVGGQRGTLLPTSRWLWRGGW